MNPLLKVVLVVLAVIVALKLLPFAFGVACFMVSASFSVIGVGVTALTALLGGGLFLVALFSPIWVPLLVIVGIVMLCLRAGRNSGTPAV